MRTAAGQKSGLFNREGNLARAERRTSVRTWLWFVVERDIEALPGKA
jgi:hypothetical protein